MADLQTILNQHLAQAAATNKQPLADDITALIPYTNDKTALLAELDRRLCLVDREQHQNAAVTQLVARGPEYRQAASLLQARYQDLRRLEDELKAADH